MGDEDKVVFEIMVRQTRETQHPDAARVYAVSAHSGHERTATDLFVRASYGDVHAAGRSVRTDGSSVEDVCAGLVASRADAVEKLHTRVEEMAASARRALAMADKLRGLL